MKKTGWARGKSYAGYIINHKNKFSIVKNEIERKKQEKNVLVNAYF
jgi:hypothetical protein